MGELESHLKNTQTNISKTIKRINKDITLLKNLVDQQSMSLDIFKESYKGKSYHVASVILNEPATDIKKRHQCYNNLKNRKVVDRNFMEVLGLIKKPQRKIPVKSIKNNQSTIMCVGAVTSKIRQLNQTDNLTDTEKNIVKTMLEQMVKELK